MSLTDDNAVTRLSTGQIECLVLVGQQLSSKEISARLNISSHTVDQRIRLALQILGAARRGEAARRVMRDTDQRVRETYQRLIDQPPYIDPFSQPDDQDPAISKQIRHADRAGKVGPSGFITEQRSVGRRLSLPLPFATKSQPRNDMGVGARLVCIMVIAMGSAFSVGMYLAGLESLSRLIQN